MKPFWIVELGKASKRLLLVRAPVDDCFNSIGIRRGRTIDESLGIVHLASFMEQFGWKAERARKATVVELPDLANGSTVGISVQLSSYRSSVEISQATKESGAIQIIMGGPYPSTRARQIEANQPSIDRVVVGKGEAKLAGLLGESVADIRALSDLPIPNRQIWPVGDVLFLGRRLALVYFVEGCPMAIAGEACKFCSIVHQPRATRREPEQILREMEGLASMGYGAIEVGSDDFAVGDPELVVGWLTDIKRGMQDRNLDFLWFIHACSRSLLKDKRIMPLLAEIGVRTIQIGVETTEKIKATIEEEDEVLRRCRQLGIGLQASFIFGNEGETPQSMHRTIDRAHQFLDWGISGLQADPLAPLPGSEAFRLLCRSRPEWRNADWVEPRTLMEAWFSEHTSIGLEDALAARAELYSGLPEDVMIAGMLLK